MVLIAVDEDQNVLTFMGSEESMTVLAENIRDLGQEGDPGEHRALPRVQPPRLDTALGIPLLSRPAHAAAACRKNAPARTAVTAADIHPTDPARCRPTGWNTSDMTWTLPEPMLTDTVRSPNPATTVGR
ncbi:hypothetical protein ACIOKD_35265 [Streptomyces sp. NPDC087844]|uniref:hypothetical protein n=1 Tax=Streptomyces sp. NPDC087844 TaxID=3365805 RepID=UPI003804B06F